MSAGYPNVQLQVTFVAALDDQGNITQSWWAFAPDEAEMKYTGPTSKKNPPDTLAWKLRAYTIDGKSLNGAAFAKQGGIVVQWPYPQPSRKDDQTYGMDVTNLNTLDPDGPYKFTATVTYKGTNYPSPDPDVVLEPPS
jgi:hypothetical protein